MEISIFEYDGTWIVSSKNHRGKITFLYRGKSEKKARKIWATAVETTPQHPVAMRMRAKAHRRESFLRRSLLIF